MERRNFLKATAGASTVGMASLAGCTATNEATNEGVKLKGFGVVKRDGKAASYVTVKNTLDKDLEFDPYFAVYDDQGVRVSDWKWTRDTDLLPGEKLRVWVVWDSDDNGWFDESELGQAVQSHETRMKFDDRDDRIYSEEDVSSVVSD